MFVLEGKSYVCTGGHVSLISDEGDIFISHEYRDTYLELCIHIAVVMQRSVQKLYLCSGENTFYLYCAGISAHLQKMYYSY